MALKKFVSNILMGGAQDDIADMRRAALADARVFMVNALRAIVEGKLRLDTFNLRDAFRALADIQVPVLVDFGGMKREIQSSAFPVLVGGLTIARMQEAYQTVETIADQLVEDMEDAKRVSWVANIHAMRPDAGKDGVEEGKEYPEILADPEKVAILSKRQGYRLSITQEAIDENNVADIVRRVNALATFAAEDVEQQTLDRVCDRYGSKTTGAGKPYVYNPEGTGTALYNSTANNPGTRAPSGTRVTNKALVDSTSFDAALTVLAAMKTNDGRRISIPAGELILLTPFEVSGTAFKLLGSEYEAGNVNELARWGPRGQFRPKLVSSTRISDIHTSAWYMGAPRRQFVRKWKLRYETMTLALDPETYLRTRIAYQARVGWDCEVGATDYVYMVQLLSGTTYT